MRQLKRAEQRDPEQRQSKIRKWLAYLTLIVAAAIIIGDLIAVIAGLLGGELAIRFSLKALTVLVITGSIFGYYLQDLRREEKEA
jgi:membrane protein YqaA with SNARE-associated domain